MKQFCMLVCSFTILLSFASCCKKHLEAVSKDPPAMNKTSAGPPVYIYKTKKDYSQLVPVTLSEDKKSIVSYPAPGDVFYQGKLAYPTPLSGGFMLDNRGISKNAAFLSMTYTEYSNLQQSPDPNELLKRMMDTDPFTEIYYCGTRYQYKDLISELNKLIGNKDFSKFRKEK
ncbi:MAG: hypothetical protein NTU44_17830 [Bacteroidetes bacterium]|nr:hypothetical protein [Bacteroidota bacterium]